MPWEPIPNRNRSNRNTDAVREAWRRQFTMLMNNNKGYSFI